MRSLIKVIDDVINEIPSECTDFKNQLKDNLSSVSCAAPEAINFWWNVVYHTLTDNIDVNNTDSWTWEWRVFSVFTGKTIDELKRI